MSGSMPFQAVTLSASDNVEYRLRPLHLGGIVELFMLRANVLDDRFRGFVDVLRPLLRAGVASRTLRLHLGNDVSVKTIYMVVERFHYVK
ncbi:hypothetical protein AAVH_40727, partial [Aphelenchoides avenae]